MKRRRPSDGRRRTAAAWQRSDLLLGRDVVARLHRGAECTLLILWLVLRFDLGKGERHLVDRNDIVGIATALIRAHEHVAERDLQEFLLVLAGLAAGERRL